MRYTSVGLLAVLCLCLGCTRSPKTELRAYIPNSGSDDVSVIRVADDTVIATIVVGKRPSGVAVSPNCQRVYITNEGSNAVSVIDTVTNRVISTITVEKEPFGVAVSRDGKTLYVANSHSFENTGTLSVITAASPYAVKETVTLAMLPRGVTVGKDGKVYVSNRGNSKISVLDGASPSQVENRSMLPQGSGDVLPEGLTPSPDGSHLYVAAHETTDVGVYNTATWEREAVIKVGIGPFAVAVSPDGRKAYASLQGTMIAGQEVVAVDLASQTVATTIPVGPMPMGLSLTPDGKKLYVANKNGNTVSVIDTASDQVIGAIGVGREPIALGDFICAAPVS